MKLFFRKLGSGPPMIILHGLYGMSDNWMTIARVLSKSFEVYLPDMRNHGRSPHSPYHNYEIMQNDIYEFCKEQGIEKAVLMGHSMGGKIAMSFAKAHPEMLTHLIIVDISPREYTTADDELSHFFNHRKIINALRSINLAELKHRDEADAALALEIDLPYVRSFLLKNLYHNTDKNFDWRVNLKAISKSLPDIMAGIDADEPITGFSVLFVRGGLSDYIIDEDAKLIEKIFPTTEIVSIENASHWLHAEHPIEFIKIVNEFVLG